MMLVMNNRDTEFTDGRKHQGQDRHSTWKKETPICLSIIQLLAKNTNLKRNQSCFSNNRNKTSIDNKYIFAKVGKEAVNSRLSSVNKNSVEKKHVAINRRILFIRPSNTL